MGWRGTLRAIEAAAKRAERESQRRHKQLERIAKQEAKLEAKEGAAYEAEVYENKIERLLSVYKEASEDWDWNAVYNTPPIVPPERFARREQGALQALEAYVPGMLDKLFGRAHSKREQLEQAVEIARQQDENEYQAIYREYYQKWMDWDERRQLAWKILQGDTQAYVDAIQDLDPLADVKEFGVGIEIIAHTSQALEVKIFASQQRIIPSEIKTLTAAGKLTVKPMAQGRSNEIFRDFVCGMALRVGREMFALLPVNSVIVTIQDRLLDSTTGNEGIHPVLSVEISRYSLDQINFERVDPTDCMSNFGHRMEFTKSAGFKPVHALRFGNMADVARGYGDSSAGSQKENFPPKLEVEKILGEHPEVSGCRWVPVSALATLCGEVEQGKLSISQRRKIASKIVETGFCIEPDANFDSMPLDWNSSVGVFKPESGEALTPSHGYLGAARLLKLCVLIASADGHAHERELDVFREIIASQQHFSGTDLKRLKVLEHYSLQNEASARSSLASVAKSISLEKRALVAEVLVRLASVDGVVTKPEFKALERIFKAFGMPAEALRNLIAKFCPSPDEVVIQEAEEDKSGEPIPSKPQSEVKKAFTLNMSKVQSIASETKEVINILSEVMEEETEFLGNAVLPQVRAGNHESCVKELNGKRFEGLNDSLKLVLNRLLMRDSWPKNDFEALAKEFHLMPLHVQDSINEWAEEALGDFVLEGDDPLLLRRDLLVHHE